MNKIWKGSPNFTKGKRKSEIVVVHIMADSLAGTDAWFANPKSQVSSHYGVGTNGEIHQYVKEEDTAWANGRVSNPTSSIVKQKGGNPNAYSISIENEGTDLSQASKVHLETLRELIDDICTRNGIPKDREHIIGHNEIYSIKTNCPSPNKSIIDTLISDMKPTKKLAEAYKDLVGKKAGDNMNEKEQDNFAEKIQELKNQPAKEVIKEVPVEVIKEVVVEKMVEVPATEEQVKVATRSYIQKFLDLLFK